MTETMTIRTKTMSLEEWRQARRKGLGGSDVAAVLGLSRYKTPLDVFNEKVKGEYEDISDLPRVKAGIKLEQVIADWYEEESGKRVQNDFKIRIHPKHPFLIANIDRLILASNGEGTGILEVKTSNRFYWDKQEDGEIPLEYYLQLQHYLNVTGHKWGEIAVLLDGYDFRRYYFERDEELISVMTEKLVDFWVNHIETQTPPEPINSEDIKKLYPKTDPDKVIEANSVLLEAVSEIKTLKEHLKEIKAEIEQKEEMIKLTMRDAELLTNNGEKLVTWKSYVSNRFDSKKFKADNPELYNKYLTQSETRRFLIK